MLAYTAAIPSLRTGDRRQEAIRELLVELPEIRRERRLLRRVRREGRHHLQLRKPRGDELEPLRCAAAAWIEATVEMRRERHRGIVLLPSRTPRSRNVFGRAEGTAPVNLEIPAYGGEMAGCFSRQPSLCLAAVRPATPMYRASEMLRLRLQCCMVARVLNMYKTGTGPRAATFLPSPIQIMQVRTIPA